MTKEAWAKKLFEEVSETISRVSKEAAAAGDPISLGELWDIMLVLESLTRSTLQDRTDVTKEEMVTHIREAKRVGSDMYKVVKDKIVSYEQEPDRVAEMIKEEFALDGDEADFNPLTFIPTVGEC